MAPPFSSTFASAAASMNGENAGNRRDNATNEWSRNRVNGAAQTFRRTSTTTPSQTQQRESAATSNTGNEGVYIPPHLNPSNSSRNLPLGDTRYGKEQMLSIYQTLKETSALDRHLDEIFLGGWEPLDGKNGAPSQGGRGDGKDAVPGPEVCWNYNTDSAPLGLTSTSEEEKQLFSTSVNSPIKLQQNPKETSGPGVIGGRKASLSTYNNTASGSRPGTRRRDTSDSFMANGPLSPTENKTFPRTETNTATPPPALLRRRTDYKEDDPAPSAKEYLDADDGAESQPTFPGLRRAGTGPLSAGLNPPSASPWSAGPQSSAFGSMGSFGSFAIGSATTPIESSDKRPGFGSARGGSRFKDLLSKTSSEDISQSIRDKTSFGALEKLPEEDADNIQSRLRDELRTRPGRSETNPYEEASMRSGSAALSSAQENLPPPGGIEQMGMSAFGPPGNIGARDFGHDDPYQQASQGRFNPPDPMSPTNTNPYHSPHGRPEDDERDNNPISQAPGLPPFGANRRNMFGSSEDRGPPASNTRTATGFGGLSGFGGLGGGSGWPSNPLGSNKPPMGPGLGSAFADPIFSPLTDLQSPSASGFGGGFFGSGGFGSAGRASRLGAMFPPAMQEQMRGDSRNEMRHTLDSRPESAQQQSIRDAFDNTNRRSEGFGRGSSLFDESPSMRSVEEATNASQAGQFGAPPSGPPPSSLTAPQPEGQRPESYQSGHGLSQSSGSNSDNQLPATQQRQMVMPDRMRWIYRDPQGNTQGPFSGLEMHDWFKAGFFTAELQVKKLEDVEYEPLAQLVRRIGNSREPFLVPQIGVPHGPPSAAQGNHWANAPVSGVGGSVQPPFASSFPSFGTTLTAEQQNALERRKQEEQFLMARQKEHLAQQQMAMKHMQMQNGMQPLQHQPSAQSLHSQPSFSSMTSPTGYQPAAPGPIQPPQLGMPFGQQGGPTSAGPAFGAGREEDLPNMMDRMSFGQRAGPFAGGPSGPPPEGPSPQQLNSMLQDRARVQQQQQQADMRGHQDAFLGPQGRNDRLDEFHELRGQADLPAGRLGPEETRPQPIGTQRHADEQLPQKVHAPIGHPAVVSKLDHEPLSLAQQVQIAAASQMAAAEEHARGKQDTFIEPPPVSISPLPAPAAQRNRQHVADALAAESRSATQTPIETPSVSIAPWAERTAEHPKGPSLREIQEAEAKRAAEQEELAAAARRAQQAEQEKLSQVLGSAPAPAPGLPSTSTWGSPASPVTPGSQSSSVWAKPTVAKAGSAATVTSKKTLAQIQKEEESRKQRAAAVAVAASAQNAAASPVSAAAVGKRYAELASKVAPTTPTTSSAWTTVGSGGKTKAPPAVVASPQPATRTVSSSTVTTAKPRPTLQTSRSTISSQSKANEEFTKWIKGSLGKGLNSNINVDSFVQDLLQLPPEIEIISDSVYASSQTLDGRRFAEEFVRRRKLADKGIVEPATNGAGGVDGKSAGGWSEVAKKGPAAAPKEENNASFKVVATKKKGKR